MRLTDKFQIELNQTKDILCNTISIASNTPCKISVPYGGKTIDQVCGSLCTTISGEAELYPVNELPIEIILQIAIQLEL